MKKLIQIIPLAASIFSMSNIEAQTTLLEPKKAGHVFYVSVPAYMQETRGLNEAASFEYQSTEKQSYLMVIDDAKSSLKSIDLSFSSPEEYFLSIQDFYMSDADKSTLKKRTLTIQNMPSLLTEFERKLENITLSYMIGVVESKEYYYQVVCWTTSDNKQAMWQDFEKIITSLKE